MTVEGGQALTAQTTEDTSRVLTGHRLTMTGVTTALTVTGAPEQVRPTDDGHGVGDPGQTVRDDPIGALGLSEDVVALF
jgi:hypothetical protein